MTDADVKKCSENGRKFIQAMIELTGAEVSATVHEKVFPADHKVDTEEEKYTADGRCICTVIFVGINPKNWHVTVVSILL
jgi:hypothetical protein